MLTLKDFITINRPIVFLCGPYYKNEDNDRRYILRKQFLNICDKNVFPLIIDDFLNDDNLPQNINIQLLEEIFSAISFKTYIFLDTLSAATELGLFMTHTVNNKVTVYLPEETDIIDIGKVGYFAKDVVIGMNKQKAQIIKYRPKIRRIATATHFTQEYYEFIDNVLPDSIENDIRKNIPEIIYEKIDCKYENIDFPKVNEIGYYFESNVLIVRLSIKLLFYITISYLYQNYKKELEASSETPFSDFDIQSITKAVTEIIERYVCGFIHKKHAKVEIRTVLDDPFEKIIFHMTAFLYTYHYHSVNKTDKFIRSEDHLIFDEPNNIISLLNLTREEYTYLTEKVDVKYVFSKKTINKKGKSRELFTYSDTEQGKRIRELHENIDTCFRQSYQHHPNAYAYNKGSSISQCVKQHLGSKCFLKFDIHKFFNSIDLNILTYQVEDVFKINETKEIKNTKKLLSSFFPEDHLPLGLIVSPVLSDIYMISFDRQLQMFAAEKNYIYTRYADDIMVSASKVLSEIEMHEIESKIICCLDVLKLRINEKKTVKKILENKGDHIRYIGINIVYNGNKNYISLGRSYINSVAKEYLSYLQKKEKLTIDDTGEKKEKLLFEYKRINGKVAYIQQIEGDEGWKKLKKRLHNNGLYFIGKSLKY